VSMSSVTKVLKEPPTIAENTVMGGAVFKTAVSNWRCVQQLLQPAMCADMMKAVTRVAGISGASDAVRVANLMGIDIGKTQKKTGSLEPEQTPEDYTLLPESQAIKHTSAAAKNVHFSGIVKCWKPPPPVDDWDLYT